MKLEQVEKELKRAINGLMMHSETDEPFEYYYDEQHSAAQLNEETVRKLAGMPADYPMKTLELEQFMQELERASNENQHEPEQFRELKQKLNELLVDVKVYKVGKDRITVYILGKTADGKIAGLKTVVVS